MKTKLCILCVNYCFGKLFFMLIPAFLNLYLKVRMLYEICCDKHVFDFMEVRYDPHYFCGWKEIA